MTLTEFLIARVEEDEAVAQAANGEQWIMSDGDETVRFLVRHDPARVLAECAALRAVVEQCATPAADPREDEHAIAFNVLDALAAIWRDHENYHPEEWA